MPTSQNRAQGELHPLGNPHFNLDPCAGKLMAQAIAEGLERVDRRRGGLPGRARALRGAARPQDRRVGQLAAPLRGVKAVSYHQDLIYLAERYGLDMVGTIETKPGVPATPATSRSWSTR